jgi:hypothetical protein
MKQFGIAYNMGLSSSIPGRWRPQTLSTSTPPSKTHIALLSQLFGNGPVDENVRIECKSIANINEKSHARIVVCIQTTIHTVHTQIRPRTQRATHRSHIEPFRLIDEQFDLFAAFEHLVNVLNHHVACAVDFLIDERNAVGRLLRLVPKLKVFLRSV